MLLVRLVFGVGIAIHGWPKIQSPTSWMGSGAPIPGVLQALAAVSEFAGGIAWALGALTPLASLGLIGTMGFATFMVHIRAGHVFVNLEHDKLIPSAESAAGYLVVAILLLFVGPGRLSIDSLLFVKNPVVQPDPDRNLAN